MTDHVIIKALSNTMLFLIAMLLLLSSCLAFEKVPLTSPDTQSCLLNPEVQLKRSEELQKIVKADQAERTNVDFTKMSQQQLKMLFERDTKRRMRVGEIFAEGCLKTANDYHAAALVFQHGNIPDHFYQTFIFARRAAELEDVAVFKLANRNLSSLGIDRYLISIGHKQLFGSQFSREKNISNSKLCFCMQPVETSFPDDYRKSYSALPLKDYYAELATLNKDKICSNVQCSTALKPTPRGSIVGLW